jgi:hypothetical protein
MTISGVDLMRSARDKILHDTDGMSWSEEHAYLQARRGWYEASLEAKPNNSTRRGALNVGRIHHVASVKGGRHVKSGKDDDKAKS